MNFETLTCKCFKCTCR